MKKVILLLLLLVIISCSSSKPSNFYNLVSTTSTKKIIKNSRKVSIGVKIVNVPNYLTKPQIITLKNSTEFNLAETHRWIEPLHYSIQRIIAENLSKYIENSTVKPINFESEDFDYTVQVEIAKFYGKMDGQVELLAFYSIRNRNSLVVKGEMNLKKDFKAIENNNYNDLVIYYSEVIDELSREIAKKIIR